MSGQFVDGHGDLRDGVEVVAGERRTSSELPTRVGRRRAGSAGLLLEGGERPQGTVGVPTDDLGAQLSGQASGVEQVVARLPAAEADPPAGRQQQRADHQGAKEGPSQSGSPTTPGPAPPPDRSFTHRHTTLPFAESDRRSISLTFLACLREVRTVIAIVVL